MKTIDGAKYADLVVQWLQEKVKGAKAKGVVLGLSGGLDSAVMAVLAKRAFPTDTLGLIMPCHSQGEDAEHALQLVRQFQIKTKTVDLTPIYDLLAHTLEEAAETKGTQLDVALGNIKSRLRMNTLYYFAAAYNYLVVGATNKSELMTGYFTKHGDSGVDLLPIAQLVKAEVRQLAEYLQVPSMIIQKPPSAGFWPGQTDEDEMGITYEELDSYLRDGDGSQDTVRTIIDLQTRTDHKRAFPMMPESPLPYIKS